MAVPTCVPSPALMKMPYGAYLCPLFSADNPPGHRRTLAVPKTLGKVEIVEPGTQTLANTRRHRSIRVDYHSKNAGGEFITLFNSFEPTRSSNGHAKNIPSLHRYGSVERESQRQDKRNVPQRGLMDIIQSWLSLRSNAKHARRHYSSPLRAGHNAANLITDSTNNRYFADLSTAKKWFKANVHSILAIYGTEHRILKEMLYLGTCWSSSSTRTAQDYALFVSHEHPDGQVDFNVFSTTHVGQPWGEFMFSFGRERSPLGPIADPQYAKVSRFGNKLQWPLGERAPRAAAVQARPGGSDITIDPSSRDTLASVTALSPGTICTRSLPHPISPKQPALPQHSPVHPSLEPNSHHDTEAQPRTQKGWDGRKEDSSAYGV
ncbi:hypothetical protein L226DRAFT_526443 [Lentinus tigrinus ALCF2SS1-7]|uniref:uncharacterized protein n=1 Tax=Lentinus tigrinus ALCF2SS1-7 TaxID=1328758 RepID=UPI001165D1FB|nr:hypothetical protein L226DRAFT_526443 [Lentinus tigrinus ALCF2SS1-7]